MKPFPASIVTVFLRRILNPWGEIIPALLVTLLIPELRASTGSLASLDPVLAQPIRIEAGIDVFWTPAGGSTFQDLNETPIPAGFFGPGSDPFRGRIDLRGVPLETEMPIFPTDTIVRRLESVEIPALGCAKVPIEMVALSLQSVSPLTITYEGQNPQMWHVFVCLSAAAPQEQGEMTIMRDASGRGGTFTASLPVRAKLVFSQVNGNEQRVLDFGTLPGRPTINFRTRRGHWQGFSPAGLQLISVPPGLVLDHDCDPATPPIGPLPGSSSFFPGVRAITCGAATPIKSS